MEETWIRPAKIGRDLEQASTELQKPRVGLLRLAETWSRLAEICTDLEQAYTLPASVVRRNSHGDSAERKIAVHASARFERGGSAVVVFAHFFLQFLHNS